MQRLRAGGSTACWWCGQAGERGPGWSAGHLVGGDGCWKMGPGWEAGHEEGIALGTSGWTIREYGSVVLLERPASSARAQGPACRGGLPSPEASIEGSCPGRRLGIPCQERLVLLSKGPLGQGLWGLLEKTRAGQ